VKIRLSASQFSALECAGLDEDFPALLRAWRGGSLVFEPAEAEALYSELNDRSNSEDATAEQATDTVLRRQARGAAQALGNLAGKVLRS
jgi:hypothetical protein